jgi:hypothetical protein
MAAVLWASDSGEAPAVQPVTAIAAAAAPEYFNMSLREIAMKSPFLKSDFHNHRK